MQFFFISATAAVAFSTFSSFFIAGEPKRGNNLMSCIDANGILNGINCSLVDRIRTFNA